MKEAGDVRSIEDEVFHAMSNDCRRRVLRALSAHDPTGPPLSIPEDIARETEDAEQLAVSLHHSHLPKLEQLGFIEYDQSTRTVVRGPQFDELQPILSLIDSHAWSE